MFCHTLCDFLCRHRDHIISYNFLRGIRHILQEHLFQIRSYRLHHLSLRHRSLVPVVIDCLLYRGQLCNFLFQLQRTDYIFSLTEPYNKIIAGIHAFLHIACAIIQFCNLVRIFLCVFLLVVFFQNLDLILKRSSPSLVNHIFQKITGIVMGCRTYKLTVVISRIIKLPQLD